VAVSNQRIPLKRNLHRATDQRASEPGYEKARRLRIGLLVFGIRETEHVPRILQDDMLEAPAGAEQRNPLPSRHPNRRQCPAHALVRAAGTNPKAAKFSQPLCPLWSSQGVSANPLMLNR